MICQPIKQFNQFSNLVIEVNELVKNFPFKDNVLQLGLQVKDPNDDSIDQFYESTGRIRRTGGMIIEPQYKFIHPKLKGGYIDQWIQSLSEYRIVRTRLMYMLPRTCYSIHSDPYPRIHLPVVTNGQCLMLFPGDNSIEHMPADGTSFYVDTTKKHTFVNCSEVPRIHLVGVVLPQRPIS
jgi:hypothetical protein